MKSLLSRIKILILIICIVIFGNIIFPNYSKGSSRIYYNNNFTYIEIDMHNMEATFYDADRNNLPVIPYICRGTFKLKQLNDTLYLLHSDPPGLKCINDMKIIYDTTNSEEVTININLGNAKKDYVLKIKSLSTNALYIYKYYKNFSIKLPKDSNGYLISILPSYEQIISIDGIFYGFHHTIKFLNIPIENNLLFATGNTIYIDVPSFNDNLFNEWCLSGDVIIIENDKLTFHGQQYNIYKGY